MELTSMLLNQLTGNNNINNVTNNTTNKGFEQVLTNVETKQNKQSLNLEKNNNYKKDNTYKENNNVKKEDLKADNKDVKTDDKTKVQNNKQNTATNTENKVKDEKVSKTEEESKDKAIIVDEETLQKLSKILNVSPEKIMDILSNLSMSVSMLQDTKNLIKFLQATFNVDSQASLLGIDNIKNIMSDIQDIAKSIDYPDMLYVDGNFKENLANIINNKDQQKFNILNSGDNKNNIKEQIQTLLDQLNGEVLESSTNIASKQDLTKNVNDVNININKNVDVKDNEQIQTENKDEKVVFLETSKSVNMQDVNAQGEETLTDNEPKQQKHMQNNQNQQNSNFANQSEQNQNKVLDQNNRQNIDFKQEVFNISEVKNDAKVFSTNMPKTQVLRNINNTEVVTQIMEKIKVSVKPEISEVKMLLKPEQLGEVSLKIATQNGVVTAQFIAESQRVKEIIEANFNQLKDMLLEQGIDVGALEVSVSDQESQQTNQQTNNGQNKNQKQTTSMFEEDDLTKIDNNQITQEDAINSMVSYTI